MVQYYVRFRDLESQAAAFQAMSVSLSRLEQRLSSIARAMDVRDQSMASLCRQINASRGELASSVRKLEWSGKAVDEVHRIYLGAERENVDANSGSSAESAGMEPAEAKVKWHKYYFDFMERDEIGAIFSIVGRPIALWMIGGKSDARYYPEALKSGTKAMGKVLDLGKRINDKNNLKLLGYSVSHVKYPFASWTARFQAGFQDSMKTSVQDFTAGGAKSALKWAGVGLSLAINGMGNYNDYREEKITADRAIASTILETAIDVGKAMVVGAVAVAVVGAVCGSAPVLAVAAVSVGLSIGLDYIVPDKNFSKFVSNTILDGSEFIGGKVSDAAGVLKSQMSSRVSSLKTATRGLKPAWATFGI